MKGKDIAITVLVTVAGVFFILFIAEKLENGLLKKKNEDLMEDKLRLLRESLKNKTKLNPEILSQIERLIQYYKRNKPISKELTDVLDQIQNGHDIKGIRDLAKIIENLLKDKFKEEPKFSSHKRIPLKSLIDHAKEINFFNEKMYHSACILNQFRNDECHKLAVEDTENMKISALLCGLEIISIFNPN